MINTKSELIEYLEADKAALGRKQKHPSLFDVVWQYEISLRYCEYYSNKKGLLAKFFGFYWRYKRYCLGLKCCFDIPLNTCGGGLCLSHIGPVIISKYAKIGSNCRIHAGVNIGADFRNSNAAPIIGDRVYIGPGAKIFGNVRIADGIAIGANAVVCKDFLRPNTSIAGVPAKVISDKGTQGVL